jgi:hypothetical protein
MNLFDLGDNLDFNVLINGYSVNNKVKTLSE